MTLSFLPNILERHEPVELRQNINTQGNQPEC